jgi:hypothetical protein
MAKKYPPFPSQAEAKSNLDAIVKRIEKTTGPLPRMPEALGSKKPSIDTVNPSVLNYVRNKATAQAEGAAKKINNVLDRSNDTRRITGSGPSMGRTLPAPGAPTPSTPKTNVDPGFSKKMPDPKYTPVPMPTPTFKSDGGRTAVPMPAPKQIGPKSKYTPVPMPTPKFGR